MSKMLCEFCSTGRIRRSLKPGSIKRLHVVAINTQRGLPEKITLDYIVCELHQQYVRSLYSPPEILEVITVHDI